MKASVYINNQQELKDVKSKKESVKNTEMVISNDEELLTEAEKAGLKIAVYTRVDDRAGLDRACELAKKYKDLIIEFKDETNIPLELVLAITEETKARVYKIVYSSDDGWVSTMTMEKGSDGIILSTADVKQILKLNDKFSSSDKINLDLKELVVKNVKHAGMGDRVCIDTTSNLGADEGMLLGSTSRGAVLVSSETHYLPYMNTRPFRVNAGGIHSYVWAPDNTTAYLSELKAGDKVLAVKANGDSRVVTVGRVKIEKRPLLLLEVEVDEGAVNVFIQDDWHVRVVGAKAEIRNATTIKPGDKLLGYLDSSGRHVGISIEETILEK